VLIHDEDPPFGGGYPGKPDLVKLQPGGGAGQVQHTGIYQLRKTGEYYD
jgi:hypothetical protein